MMIFLSEIIFVFIQIQKVGHFSCLFSRYVSVEAINMRVNPADLHNPVNVFYIIHCMCKHKHVFTLLCKLNIYIIRHLFQTDNRDPKGCHQNILSELKQSRYCIILIVSFNTSINVSQISMFRNCKNYKANLLPPHCSVIILQSC